MGKDTHQKTGAVFASEVKTLKDRSKQALIDMKKLEKSLFKQGKIKTYHVGSTIVSTTFDSTHSPIINYMRNDDSKIKIEEVRNITV